MDDFIRAQYRNSFPLERNTIGIYFLFNKGKLVYIGQTTKGHSRIFQHNDKKFDSYSFQPYLESVLNEVEEKLILKYKPLYNKTFLKKVRNYKKIDRNYITALKAVDSMYDLRNFLTKDRKERKLEKIMDNIGVRYKREDRGNHRDKLCVFNDDVNKLRKYLKGEL